MVLSCRSIHRESSLLTYSIRVAAWILYFKPALYATEVCTWCMFRMLNFTFAASTLYTAAWTCQYELRQVFCATMIYRWNNILLFFDHQTADFRSYSNIFIHLHHVWEILGLLWFQCWGGIQFCSIVPCVLFMFPAVLREQTKSFSLLSALFVCVQSLLSCLEHLVQQFSDASFIFRKPF